MADYCDGERMIYRQLGIVDNHRPPSPQNVTRTEERSNKFVSTTNCADVGYSDYKYRRDFSV